MEDMKPKRFPVAGILIIIGVILLIIGIICYKTGDNSKYYQTEDISENYSSADVETLEFNCGVGVFRIEQAIGDEIIVEGKNIPKDRYKISCSDGKFKIAYEDYKWYEWYKRVNIGVANISIGPDTPEFTVYLPEKVYQKFIFNAGVGEYSITDFSCVDADLNFGVGEGNFTNVAILGEADIDCGVGETRFTDCSVSKTDIQCGVGELRYSGKITGELDVSGGIGECRFDIDGYYSDYRIKTDSGLGEVDIDRGTDAAPENSGTPIPITLENGIGEIRISFK